MHQEEDPPGSRTFLVEFLSETVIGPGAMSSRHYLAPQHLWTARYHAARCADIETGLVPATRTSKIEHRSHAITAVMSSVAFLEALVNEVFQDAADSPTYFGGHVVDTGLSDESIALMGRFWKATKDGTKYMSVIDKFQMALLLSGKDEFQVGANPIQNANYLMSLRNLLVHFRPESLPHGQMGNLEKKLSDKFEPTNFMISRHDSWFPAKCLGAGCARWACETSQALADDWTERMEIAAYYEIDEQRGWMDWEWERD